MGLGCVKTLRGMTAPGILMLVVTFRAKKAEICPPLSITTKSDFVFTRPGSKPEAAVLVVMSAPPSCGHTAALTFAALCHFQT
jgi:hypothetical protein